MEDRASLFKSCADTFTSRLGATPKVWTDQDGDIRTDLRRALPCWPCTEYQAGQRVDVVLGGSVRVHVCEHAPKNVLLPCPADSGCPCGCVLP